MDFFTRLYDSVKQWLPDFFDKKKLLRATGIILSFLIALYFFGWSAPKEFPKGRIFTVEKGMGISEVAQSLKTAHVIRSIFWYKVFAKIYDGQIGAGDYVLNQYQNVFGIVRRLADDDYRLVPIRVTIPEGTSSKEMAVLLRKQLQKFDTTTFLDLATPFEGDLFPDTYYFLPNNDPAEVVRTLTKTFSKRIVEIKDDIAQSKRPLEDIVTMASIVEEEGNNTRDREIIAGILWKRIAQGMALQIDVPFDYSIGKTSEELTLKDLATDSPYNTYLHKGLPPTPITNPGLESLRAVLHPIATPYYFFISDKKGDMHYAVTYEEHLANKEIYLR